MEKVQLQQEVDHRFWYLETDEQGGLKKIHIVRRNLIDFLHQKGFAKIKLGEKYLFVYRKNRVFKEVQPIEIKEYVNLYIDKLNKRNKFLPGSDKTKVQVSELREAILKGTNVYFGAPVLENLPTVPFNPLKDTADKAYLFFLNGFVQISKDKAKLYPYVDLDGDIWKDQRIEHEIELTGDTQGEFQQFLDKICGENNDRYASVCSYLGFMLHSYRDPARPQVVVLYDEKDPDKPQDYDAAQGGTGKGLLITGLSKIKKTVVIDGKSFRYGEFPWQRINVTTQLVAFQDITKGFKFANLHSAVTDGISVNKKHRPEIFIPYSESPKFIITTNYVINTSDESDQRRIKEIELAPYFGPRHTPKDHFGHLLFEDWDHQEWNRFFNGMIECISLYLSDGFIDPEESRAAKERKFIFKHGQEVFDVLNGLQISTTRVRVNGLRHITSEIRAKCTESAKNRTFQYTFPKALREYALMAPDIEPPVDTWVTNSKRYFLFYGKEKRDLSNK